MDDEHYLQRAILLTEQVPLIDAHNDFPFIIRGLCQNRIGSFGVDLANLPIGQTDLSRLRQGRVGGQFWSAFVPGGTRDGKAILLESLQQIDLIHVLIEKCHSVLGHARTASDVWKVFRSGRIASLIGVEGLHQINGSPSVLRTYHRLGVRYITLTHNCDNEHATSSTSSSGVGLSDSGREIVREMNRVGMMIDLSHTSEATQRDALELSEAPVIFSHSSCSGVTANSRNVSDEVLDLLQRNRGVIMICFLQDLVGEPPGEKATVSSVVDHILYAAEKIGFDHVGLGSDFDGMLQGPEGIHDVSQYPSLVAELLRRGVSDDQVKQILGLNVLRVMEEVEQTSRQIRLSGAVALCDDIDAMWTEEQESLLREVGQKRRFGKGQDRNRVNIAG